MRTTTVRSTNSTMLLWVGAVGVFIGGFTGLYGLAMLLQNSLVIAAVCTVAGALIALAGIAVLVVGWRTNARADATGVSWARGLSARAHVPWEQVARVLVPGKDEPGDTVALLLRDGSIVPVTSLQKIQHSDFGTVVSPWYQRAGATLQGAHQQWLASRHSR